MDETLMRLAAGAAGAMSLAELGAATIEPLRQLTGAGRALLYAYDERGMIGLGGDDWIPEIYRPYWSEDPTQAETKRLPPGPRIALADRLVGRKRLRQSRAYLEFYRPCELEHLCCVYLTNLSHGSPGMTNVFLARSPKQEPYQKRETRILEQAVPLLSAAVNRLRRSPLESVRKGEEALLEWGRCQPCLAVSLEGHIDWVSPAAAALMRDAVPTRLPDALVARLRLLSPTARPVGLTPPFAHWRLPGGQLLRVDLSPPTILDGYTRVLVLLSEVPTQGSDVRHSLSPAQVNVMECLAAGSSTLEIATTLSLSEATVRTHLRNIYGKLGVHSRTEAVLCWQMRANSAS